MAFKRFIQVSALFALLIAPSFAKEAQRPQPEISTGLAQVSKAVGTEYMIVTANPLATQAGADILKKGGSAVDAAITAQLVLGLVEPQSSGLGGGAFMLHYDAKNKKLTSYDGRETAPSLAGPFLFQELGQPMDFMTAVVGGRAVGVPGIPALLKDAHDLYGKLTWMELFDAPIKLASDGFVASPRLAKMVEEAAPRLAKNKNASAYFLTLGAPVKAGDTLVNTAYEQTLRDYAFYGPSRFYQGFIAKDIVETVQNIEANPGLLTLEDFAAYEVKPRDPVCGPYRSYIVCSMGEPSSGALTILNALGILEGFEVTNDAKGRRLIVQASALAFADRNLYMADPDFVNTPNVTLLDPEYIKTRAALITPDAPLTDIVAGVPKGWGGPLYKQGISLPEKGTSHISIVDRHGNIVSMTTTVEGAFGSHVMTNGFLLNNQLTDFAFTPIAEDQSLVANMAEGGKRPRSSMSPTIVFNADGAPVLVVGSAGGSHIIGYVLEQIIAAIDWKLSPEGAMALPHTLSRNGEVETENPDLAAALKAAGAAVDVKTLNSGLTAIHIQGDNYIGVADPRREGLAQGE